MDTSTFGTRTRMPRFRRAAEPPPLRLTDGDVEIVRVIRRHRLIRSTHIAALVGRSLDRTNDRLMRAFHAGHVDRPRAQLDPPCVTKDKRNKNRQMVNIVKYMRTEKCDVSQNHCPLLLRMASLTLRNLL